MTTRSERVFRALLRAYPRSTRAASGEDMAQSFGDRLRDAGTPIAKGRVWVEAFADIAATAPRERLASRRAAAVAAGLSFQQRGQTWTDLLVGTWPWLVIAFIAVVSPGFADPLFDSRVALAGLPLGTAVLGLTAILASFGSLAARPSAQLAEVEVQVFLLGAVLVPVPAMFLVLQEVQLSVAYAFVVTLLVLALPMRLLMLALVVPFLAWLVIGPAIVLVVIALGGG